MQQPNGLSQTVRRFIITALILTTGHTMAASSGGKLELELEDYGSFFVNGRTIQSNHPGASLVTGPGNIIVNQMYVQYRVPAGRKNIPVVMVHGIAGNSHMMMMDKNNLQVADAIQKWILQNATK